MGLMRWMRGGDENSATASALGAGMAEIDALFRPARHKQTEHIEEARRRKVDVTTAGGLDLDRGIMVFRRPVASAVPAAPETDADDAAPRAPEAPDSVG